jgi:predicted transposase/invertase (TIGR01784 family)
MRQKAWRDRMSQFDGYYREGLQEGRQEGRQEGLQEGRWQVARNLKAIGIPIDQIVRGTGLTEDQIKAL